MRKEIVNYLNTFILLKVATLKKQNKSRKAKFLLDNKDMLIELAVENLDDLSAIRDNPSSIHDPLDNYLNVIKNMPLRDRRGLCCSEWIGIWPFCNKDC